MSRHTHERNAEVREAATAAGYNSITNAACGMIARHIATHAPGATVHATIVHLNLRGLLHIDGSGNISVPDRGSPPFKTEDYRERCPRCDHSDVQKMSARGLYECNRCWAIFYACEECGARDWELGPTGCPMKCQACNAHISGPIIV